MKVEPSVLRNNRRPVVPAVRFRVLGTEPEDVLEFMPPLEPHNASPDEQALGATRQLVAVVHTRALLTAVATLTPFERGAR